MACRYLPYWADQHLSPESNRLHNMDPLVPHRLLPILCTPAQRMRHRGQQRQRLIIPLSEDRRRQIIRDPTNRASLKVAQLVLPQVPHIMGHQMDEDTAQLQLTLNGNPPQKNVENPLALPTRTPFPLDLVVSRMGLILARRSLILDHQCMQIVFSLEETTILGPSQFGNHCIQETNTMIGTIQHTRMQRERGRSAMLPYRESENSATELTMNTAIACSNRTMRREMPPPITVHQNLESSLVG